MYIHRYMYIYIYIERERDTHGSFPIGFISNWARFYLGSILIAFLPKDSPNHTLVYYINISIIKNVTISIMSIISIISILIIIKIMTGGRATPG